MLNNESLVETVAELMDDADTVLEFVGISIDESVEDPQEFVETLAEILEENEFDADVAESLRLGASIIESLMQNLNEDTETTEGSWSPEQRRAMRHQKSLVFGGSAKGHQVRRDLDRAATRGKGPEAKAAFWKALRAKNPMPAHGDEHLPKKAPEKAADTTSARDVAAFISKKNPKAPESKTTTGKELSPAQQAAAKSARVMKTSFVKPPLTQAEKLAAIAAQKAKEASAHKGVKITGAPNPEKLAAIKAKHAAILKHYDLVGKVSPIGSRDDKDAAQKKAAGESVDAAEELLAQVVEAVEAAGYEVPEDVSVEDFLEATEALAETDNDLAEALGGTLADLATKAAKSKLVKWGARKVFKAGTKALTRKLDATAKPTATPVKLSNVSPSNAAEDLDTLVATMVEMLTSNGYEFEGDAEHFDSESFVEAAREIAETDEDLDGDVSAWLKNASAEVKARMLEDS